MAWRITWHGHAWLANRRAPGIWKSIKEKVGGSINTVGLSIIGELGASLIKKGLGLP